MTIGVGTYAPFPKFRFIRSYIKGVVVRIDTPVFNYSDGLIEFRDGTNVNRWYRMQMRSGCWQWNSNAYSLDFVITESYFVTNPSPTQTAMPFRLEWYTSPVDKAPYLLITPYSLAFTNYRYVTLPPAPSGYWLPPFT